MIKDNEFGTWAEEYVAQYLTRKGYTIVDKNYRKPWGEVDIIVEKEGILVFTEVKASKNDVLGFEPEGRAGKEKLKKINRAAQTYLASRKYSSDQNWQIDIVSLVLDENRGVAKIKHFKNVDL